MRTISAMTLGFLTLSLGAAVLTPAPAAAQIMGLFYQEVEKDGRVYVFADPKTYEDWKGSGEMGKSVTLVGRAVDGKTLVAENEVAVDLYMFKHNLPGYERAIPAPPKPAFDIAWKDGKTTIKNKNSELTISNRVQVRFTEQDPENGSSKGSFRIRRAKTKFEGWIYTKNLKYELQMNWPSSGSALEDANLNWDVKGDKSFQVKVGQFKAPFGRQELTSSGSQQFVDRSAVSNEFAKGRDIGIQLHGQPAGGTIDWRVGVFNGAGINVSSNDNDKYQYTARLGWQPFGDVKYSEGDFESSNKPLFGLAVNWNSNDKHGATSGDDIDQEIVGIDFAFKFKGFSLTGEYFDAENDREIGTDFDNEGFYVQAGYFFVPKKFETALRYAVLDPNSAVSDNDRTETGIGFSYYFNKHAHKLQADFRQLENDATGVKDKEIRLQYQFIF